MRSLLCLQLAAAAAAAAAPAAAPSLTVAVSRDAAAAPLPPAAFVGFSGVEASLDVLSATASDGSYVPRPSYSNLMSLLGFGVNHRLGHFWATADGARPPGVSPSWLQANASVLARLSAALDAWGGVLTATIGPTDRTDASLVVSTATALVAGVGTQRLISLELANEPDISSFAGNYSGYVEVLRMWTAGLAAVPGLPQRLVDAPVLAGTSWWPAMPSFLAQFAQPPSFALAHFVQHRYALSACGNVTNTPARLMNASTTWDTANDTALLGAVAGAGLDFVVGEGNSVACQGSPGVSDVWASALYAVQAGLDATAANITGYKWHGLGYAVDAAYYQPVFYDTTRLREPGWDAVQPRPLFLGLWAFSEAARPGSVPLRATASITGAVPPRLLPAWALRSPDGARVTVAVLHKVDSDGDAPPAAVTVVPATPCTPGTDVATLVRLLPGPGGLSARGGCSYANLTFDGTTDGVPAGVRAAERVPCGAGGAYAFAVPPASGAFLTYDDAA